MTGHESVRHLEWFDHMLESTFTIVAVILFIISISLLILGLIELVRGWNIMFGSPALDLLEETPSSVLITGLGMIVIGIAVLDLTKSILDEKRAQTRQKNAQERARDFLTRFLPVIIFAISAEIFVRIAQVSSTVQSGLFLEMAIVGIAVGVMLGGLAIYLRMTAAEGK